MAESATQLSFDLRSVPALGRADFLVAPSNAIALAAIEAWHGWPGGKLVLTGPRAAGKTHLAHVWASQAGARIVAARELPEADLPALLTTPLAVEDIPQIAGNTAAETALFHLHNMAGAAGIPLLLTGRRPAPRWEIALPDLASRLAACQTVRLDPPDDALLAALLAKLFSDRQLTPGPDLIPYLLRRMDRSYSSACDLVAALDATALSQGRAITRRLAAGLLDNLDGDTQ